MSDDKTTLESLMKGKVSLGGDSPFASLLGTSVSEDNDVQEEDTEQVEETLGLLSDKVEAPPEEDAVEDAPLDFEEAEEFDEQELTKPQEQSTQIEMGGALESSLLSRYAGSASSATSAPVVSSTPVSSPVTVSPTTSASTAVVGSETGETENPVVAETQEEKPVGVSPSEASSILFTDDEFVPSEEVKPKSAIVAESADGNENPEDSISYEDKFRYYADKVLGAVLHDGKEFQQRRKWLFSQITPDLFMGENFLIYTALFRKREDLINLGEDYLRMYYRDRLADIKKSGHGIDLSTYDSIDGSPELGYLEGTIKHWSYLTSLEQIEEDEFHRAHETYVLYYKNLELARTLSNGMEILQEGLNSSGKKGMLAGSGDSVDYVRRRFATIEGATERNQGTGFISLKEFIENPEDNVKPYKVSDYHNIEELNEHFGGIMSGQLITPVGPSKGGKSKLCARIVHQATTVYGHNVTVWPVEGGNNLFSAQIRAIQFDNYYNDPTKVSREEMRFGVDQETIAFSKWGKFQKPDEMRQMELQSASDLVTNVNYGNIDLIDRDFNVDTFMDEIDTSVQSNGSSLVMIDYAQLIGVGSKGSKREAIAEAYPKLLSYAKKNNVAIVSPAQYAQSAMSNMSGGGEQDIRTAIGESSEIMRSSDIVISMFATVDELQNNRLKFQSIPSRYAQPFEEFYVNIDLGRCLFSTIEQ